MELTGLSSSTVSHAVAKLLADGRIAESEAEVKGPGSGSGRPATFLTAVAAGAPTAAIDFGASHVGVALGDSLGNSIEEVTIPLETPTMPQPTIDLAVAALQMLQAKHEAPQLSTVVVGIPGPVDRTTGKVCSPTVVPSWVGLNPSSELRDRIPGAVVQVHNDAVLGAYGELQRGAGRQHENFVYVKASHGIGAGIVINGQLYHGATGVSGELGHTQLPGHSELCRCGNRGCLEAVINVDTVKEQIAHTHPHLDPGQIVLTDAGDAVNRRILGEAGRTLGKALADVCNLLNPTALILGGELGSAGEPLVAGVRSSVQRLAQPATTTTIEVRAATFGRRAELVGALALAAELTQV